MATPKVKIDPFNPSKISFELWLSLLEANFSNLNISEASKKKNVLLVSVGTDIFAVLGNICAPDLPHTKSYEDLVNLLKAHYDVKPSYHRSLLSFQQRKKKEGESLKELYADLKRLAKDCDFKDQFDSRVRDQLFMSVENEIYFANLVAENLDLKSMKSAEIFERVLNLEKAFVSEKSCIQKVTWENECVHQVKSNKNRFAKKPLSCRHCGYPHDSDKCRFKNLTCNNCNEKGHLKQVCPNQSKDVNSKVRWGQFSKSYSKTNKAKNSKCINVLEGEEVSSDTDEDKLLSVKSVNAVNKEEVFFKIEGKLVPFEVDTGAAVSTLTEDWVIKLGLPIKECTKVLSAYDDFKIKVLGKVTVNICYNSYQVHQSLYVVGNHNSNLCGKNLMQKVGIFLSGIDDLSRVNNITGEVSDLLDNYQVDANNPISGIVADIHVRGESIPKFSKPRSVPFHYKPMVEEALNKMVDEKVIEPINHSQWAAPIVTVLKPDKESVRICGDFKQLNECVSCDQYPLPKVDELLADIGKGKIFSTIDLKNAYLQIPVGEESQKFLLINTHKGLFKFTRLPFGLSSSPAIFQRFIANLLKDVEGVGAFLDDIIIGGEDEQQHDERLSKVLQILKEHNVQINKKKCAIKVTSLEYLGYLISGEGISPSPTKVKAIQDAPSPSSVAELQSFIGMLTFYCKFIKNFSSKMAPLYDLLKKNNVFKWTECEQKVFDDVKYELLHAPILANYDGQSPLIIEVDASPVGVGCVLLQRMNGKEFPVYFASKRLTSAEQNYAQIDREGLGLVFGVNRFRYFLLGRKFEARTDHKPLLGLFSRGCRIPSNANARIQRWALLLSQYDFDLVYKAGKENVVADALSRLPVADNLKSIVPFEYVKLVEVLDFDDVSFQSIKNCSRKDEVLCALMSNIRYGWHDNDSRLSEYGAVKSDLSLYDDVVLYRNRILIPSALRYKILEHLHSGHNGINAMKAEARTWVWWPGIDQDIGEITKNCHICFTNFQPHQAPVLSWPSPGKSWSRIHIDYAGPVEGKYFLVIIDAYSKFLDVHVTGSMTSSVTIELLRKNFCNYGIPDIVVSENAPYFVSEEIESFYKKNGINHITPAPYKPSSNGLAERAVRTLKEGLSKFKTGSLNTRLCRFLYNYRKTSHSVTGKSPAEMMFGRKFKSTLSLVKNSSSSLKESHELTKRLSSGDGVYRVGDAVFAKNFGKGEPWVAGKIVQVLGVRNYMVEVNRFGIMLWKRHHDQLMHRFFGEKELESAPTVAASPIPSMINSKPIVPVSSSFSPSANKSSDMSNDVPNVYAPPSIVEDILTHSDSSTVEPYESGEVDKDCSFEKVVPPSSPVRKSKRVSKPPDRLGW